MQRQHLDYQPLENNHRSLSTMWRAFSAISVGSGIAAAICAFAQYAKLGIPVLAGMEAGKGDFVDYGLAFRGYWFTFGLVAVLGGGLFFIWLWLAVSRWLLLWDMRRRSRAAA